MDFPDDAYLRAIGELAWRVSGLESLVIDDLNAADPPAPNFSIAAVQGDNTYGIGRTVAALAQGWTGDLGRFGEAAGAVLMDVAERRNHVLHARPGTDPKGRQRLYRAAERQGVLHQFWVDDDYVADQIEAVIAARDQLDAVRMTLRDHRLHWNP